MCCATYEEGPGVAVSGKLWGTRWYLDVDWETKNEAWDVGVGENGNVRVHRDVAGDRSGRLDYGWNFSWDECGVSDKEDRVGSVDDKWSKVVSSSEENTWC